MSRVANSSTFCRKRRHSLALLFLSTLDFDVICHTYTHTHLTTFTMSESLTPAEFLHLSEYSSVVFFKFPTNYLHKHKHSNALIENRIKTMLNLYETFYIPLG
jgi:hypothetical protein